MGSVLLEPIHHIMLSRAEMLKGNCSYLGTPCYLYILTVTVADSQIEIFFLLRADRNFRFFSQTLQTAEPTAQIEIFTQFWLSADRIFFSHFPEKCKKCDALEKFGKFRGQRRVADRNFWEIFCTGILSRKLHETWRIVHFWGNWPAQIEIFRAANKVYTRSGPDMKKSENYVHF